MVSTYGACTCKYTGIINSGMASIDAAVDDPTVVSNVL